MGVSLTERIAATNPTKPRFIDVKVSIDAELSEQREALEAELKAAKEKDTDRRQGQVDPTIEIQERIDALEAQESGQLLTLRFTKLSGLEWTELATAHTARPKAGIDASVGFNYPKVCTLAAETNGVLVDGDDITPIKSGEWKELWASLSGFDVGRIFESIWTLNVAIHAGRLSRLGKA